MNNKKRNRKGFTIVELSIVIAVIAILAAVMIPVFGNIVGESRKAAAARNAQSIYSNYVNDFVVNNDDGEYESDLWIKTTAGNKTYYVQIVNGGVSGEAVESIPDSAKTQCYYLIDGTGSWQKIAGCAAGDTCANKANH